MDSIFGLTAKAAVTQTTLAALMTASVTTVKKLPIADSPTAVGGTGVNTSVRMRTKKQALGRIRCLERRNAPAFAGVETKAVLQYTAPFSMRLAGRRIRIDLPYQLPHSTTMEGYIAADSTPIVLPAVFGEVNIHQRHNITSRSFHCCQFGRLWQGLVFILHVDTH